MKLLFITFFIFRSSLTYSQSDKITKRILKNSFKKSIRYKDYNDWNDWSGYWETNNIDSTYYKSDTIILINKIGSPSVGCKFVTWDFYKKNRFYINDINTCNTISSVRVITRDDYYRVKIKEKDSITYIITKSLKTETIYKVLSFEVLPDRRTLKLQKLSQRTINR
ncbi:hypothetical protein DVK85_02015 [Flavobacterium arcticum]|uniref:Uncharacterized protein n=1 Tax=Flavobacterium arcticum TaxID=1784713 RepID=A0A345H911_9FLAO|nr:hypothetical protein [Flavobacterium arcticum]AXG73071.1 hypothetical protein DVK85_02015 [Flavobacterium arcticum]KAF2512863.1 hypothetical protein E0W72_00085 [Flavobacterium arcticum]